MKPITSIDRFRRVSRNSRFNHKVMTVIWSLMQEGQVHHQMSESRIKRRIFKRLQYHVKLSDDHVKLWRHRMTGKLSSMGPYRGTRCTLVNYRGCFIYLCCCLAVHKDEKSMKSQDTKNHSMYKCHTEGECARSSSVICKITVLSWRFCLRHRWPGWGL